VIFPEQSLQVRVDLLQHWVEAADGLTYLVVIGINGQDPRSLIQLMNA
jgi:hypothetical protein